MSAFFFLGFILFANSNISSVLGSDSLGRGAYKRFASVIVISDVTLQDKLKYCI